jgi:hypothetical protein
MIRYVLIIAGFLFLSGCSNQKEMTWYKGNLHTHTYWSDGDEFPEMVLDWYKTNGYNFIGLSDHNTIANDEKWVVIAKSPLYEKGFQEYLNKFGADWVQYKSDSSRTQVKLKTFEEYRSKMASETFLIIPSEEITNRVAGKPLHMNATNLQEFIPPSKDTTVAAAMQSTINDVLNQREKTRKPMFPHINHPNFGWGVTVEDIISVKGERFFEVFNGHPMVHNYGDSLHISTEEMWDQINIAYANRNQPFMFGLATDDSHNYHQFGESFSNAGRGWVMVQAESLSAESLIAAMEAGRFYASTGVSLSHYEIKDEEIQIHITEEKGVNYIIEFIGVSKNEAESRVLKKIEGPQGSFKVTDDFLFVRARITSTKLKNNPFQEGDFEMAWTQPVQRSTTRNE